MAKERTPEQKQAEQAERRKQAELNAAATSLRATYFVKPSTPEQKQAEREAWASTAEALSRSRPFQDRGFSQRTIDALVAQQIKWPEWLLSMSDAELRALPGIGKAAMQEIAAYRAMVRR